MYMCMSIVLGQRKEKELSQPKTLADGMQVPVCAEWQPRLVQRKGRSRRRARMEDVVRGEGLEHCIPEPLEPLVRTPTTEGWALATVPFATVLEGVCVGLVRERFAQ